MYFTVLIATFIPQREKSHDLKSLTFALTLSALILVCDWNFVRVIQGKAALAIPCFCAWVCFPGLAISFEFHSPYPHCAGVPSPLPMGLLRLGESAQVTKLGSVMFMYCSSVKS